MNNLKSILLLIIFISFNNFASEILFGIKGGLSIHKIFDKSNTDNSNTQFQYRIAPTLNALIALNQSNYFQHNFLFGYFQAGGVCRNAVFMLNPGINENGELIRKLDYLNLAYCLHIIFPNYLLKPFFIGGCQIDYLCNYDEIGIINNKEYIMSYSKYSILNKFNITPLIGLGVKVIIKNMEIFTEFLNSYEILPYYKDQYHSIFTYGYIINIGIMHKI